MDNRFLGSIAATSFKNLFPNSVSKKQKMKNSVRSRSKSNSENIPPIDSNIHISDPPLLPSNSFPKKSPSKPSIVYKEIVRSEPRSNVPVQTDPPVKVWCFCAYLILYFYQIQTRVLNLVHFLWVLFGVTLGYGED